MAKSPHFFHFIYDILNNDFIVEINWSQYIRLSKKKQNK